MRSGFRALWELRAGQLVRPPRPTWSALAAGIGRHSGAMSSWPISLRR
jgi:hypothetical protein